MSRVGRGVICKGCGIDNYSGVLRCANCGRSLVTLADGTAGAQSFGSAPPIGATSSAVPMEPAHSESSFVGPGAHRVGSTRIGVAQPGSGNQMPPSVQAAVLAAGSAAISEMPQSPRVRVARTPTAEPAAESVPKTVLGIGETPKHYVASTVDRQSCRSLLTETLRRGGLESLGDPAALEATLERGLHRDIALVVLALREGVPDALLGAASGGDVAGCVETCAHQLSQAHGLSEEDARYAVDSWALALGLGGR